ncbi:fimbrillin family protein [Bacteroides sp. BFG-257]|uniref:fimbrillin family protein n=1 Tax=Bacteroides TaxID=816 RepID=UPI001CCEB00A|nr:MULTISPECIES: fimbrillin family protein [Bacteroides]UBD68186.1 fimbrillin family protein [Bacteroides cellulosilyticus]UVO96875.1 fimbrillin family protein [Bacteroides sp. BFG-257]
MNVRFRTWILALLPFFLSACGGSASPGSDEPSGPVPIGFSPAVEAQTRGTDYNKNNLPSLGVLAYLTQGSEFTPASSTPNFMYNQEVTKAGSSWTYTPIKFWPANSNDKLTFFAYAPHNATGLTLPGSTDAGYPSFTYEVKATEAEQTDLLLASPVLNQTAGAGTVNFSFKHALTRVVINVEAGSGFTGVTINSLSIKTKKTGTVAFKSPTSVGATDWMQWSNIASGAENDISCAATLPSSSSTVTAGATQKIATFFLLPVAATSAASEKATLSFTYTMNGVGDTRTVTDLELPSPADWLPSTSITYNLKISRDAVTAEVSSISVWSGTNVNMDKGGEIAEGYKAEDIKTGDYYYNDGTWSDGGYRVLTDGTALQYSIPPMAGKTCIGIVYANGKTGEEREDNISKYSGTGLNGKIRIQGYVVALDITSGVKRGGDTGSVSTNATAFTGYSDSQTLSTDKGTSPLQVLAALEIFNAAIAAPAFTSGWYLMSAGQTKYAYENRAVINKSRKAIAGYNDMDFDNLWTSSYNVTGNGYFAIFKNGAFDDSQSDAGHPIYPAFTF